ncbi:MAG: DUF2971 domain-containing protein [Butyrivibrio sp.]|nr:DUF2971 domain-containing protein [Butyrivibrio sp.]
MSKRYMALETAADDCRLYHYTQCSSMKGIVAGKCMYATDSSFLNDINEVEYILSIADIVIGEVVKPEWRTLLRRQIHKTMQEMRKADYYVISFSTDPDSITLWSEFGNQTGYNIGFNAGELIKRIEKEREIFCHGYVIYDYETQKEIISSLLFKRIPSKIGKNFEDIMNSKILHGDCKEFDELCKRFRSIVSIYALFFKQQEFEAEREYRIVFRNCKYDELMFRERDGFLMPFIKVGHINEELMPITSITVAPKNHVDLARKGAEKYLEHMGYKNPTVYLSKLKLRY